MSSDVWGLKGSGQAAGGRYRPSAYGVGVVVGQGGLGLRINPLAMTDTRLVRKKFGYNKKNPRARLVATLDELDRVLEHFFEILRRPPSVIHIPKVMAFAISRPVEWMRSLAFGGRIWVSIDKL